MGSQPFRRPTGSFVRRPLALRVCHMTPATCESLCHPADLLTSPPSKDTGRRWFVVQTLARQEKSLARDLYQRDIPFYLPLLRRTLSYKGRRAISWIPLFPGYLFICVTDEERHVCLTSQRAASLIEVHNPFKLVHDLNQVFAAIANGSNSHPSLSDLLWQDDSKGDSLPSSVAPGNRVESGAIRTFLRQHV